VHNSAHSPTSVNSEDGSGGERKSEVPILAMIAGNGGKGKEGLFFKPSVPFFMMIEALADAAHRARVGVDALGLEAIEPQVFEM
jgi:hypothetical protein